MEFMEFKAVHRFMAFSVSVKHIQYKKDKKLFPHIASLLDVTYSFTRAIKHIFIYCLLFVVQSSIRLQQKETGTNT